MKKILRGSSVLVFGLLLILGCATHDPWTKGDKVLFGALCTAQVADFVATERHLDNPQNYVYSAWSWKYGSDRPSDGTVALVKAAELGIAYIIVDALPQEYRKWVLIPLTGLLTYCAIDTW